MTGILARVGVAVKRGADAAKGILLLVPRVLIYPIKKPFASWGEIGHDIKFLLKGAVGIDVSKKEKRYDLPIEIAGSSKSLGVEIVSYKRGIVKFLASRTLTGDIPYLTTEQLGKIEGLNKNKENRCSSMAIFREENKVVVEVNIWEIDMEIRSASENRKKNTEEIRKLVLKGIYDEVDRNIKGLAEVTGGEFKVHTDRKLLRGIAEKLYLEYDSRDRSVEEFNITNPSQFPFHFSSGAVSPAKMRLPQGIEEQVKGLGASFLNFDSDEAVKPISRTAKDGEKVKGRG